MTDLAWTRERLAKLCNVDFGKCVGRSERHFAWQGGEMSQDDWHPDLDVGQAIRCASSMPSNMQVVLTLYRIPELTWAASMGTGASAPYAEDAYLPRAIVKAIAAALGWQKTGEP